MRKNALRSRLVRILVALSAYAVFAGGALAIGQSSTAARPARGASLAHEGFRDAGRAITDAVDADAVVLSDGRLRMYYGVGGRGSDSWRIASSISTDGRHWARESTNLRGRRWGPADVVRLPDGRFRMYYTPSDDPGLPPGQQRSVRSAISDDGINWTAEEGYRLNPAAFPRLIPPQGVQYQVSHPGVVQLRDGTWLMLAAFSIERGFDRRGFSSNDTTELIVWATSPDGLTFTARGIAVDSRNKATFDGYASSPDPVIWPDGTVRAFFWSPGPQRPHPNSATTASCRPHSPAGGGPGPPRFAPAPRSRGPSPQATAEATRPPHCSTGTSCSSTATAERTLARRTKYSTTRS